jgi:hypothetical protein
MLFLLADVLQFADRWLFYPVAAWLARDMRRAMLAVVGLTVLCWRTPLWLVALYVFAAVGLACAARYGPSVLRRYAREREPRRRTVIRSPLGAWDALVPAGRDPENGAHLIAPRWWVYEQRRRGGWGGR